MMMLFVFLLCLIQFGISLQKSPDYTTFDAEHCSGLVIETLVSDFREYNNENDTCSNNASHASCCFATHTFGAASGVYTVEDTSVYCDVNGGWMTFLKRSPDSDPNDFNQTWEYYSRKEGFGTPTGDHWIGLDLLHQTTETCEMELQIELRDSESDGPATIVNYDYFHVGGPLTDYVLTLGKFSGHESLQGFSAHNNSRFSTPDWDRTLNHYRCAKVYGGGWWYAECFSFLPTGIDRPVAGLAFVDFDSVEMKIRPWSCHY